jgi:hypothetical protein
MRTLFGLRQVKVCLAVANGQSHELAAQFALCPRTTISAASALRVKSKTQRKTSTV